MEHHQENLELERALATGRHRSIPHWSHFGGLVEAGAGVDTVCGVFYGQTLLGTADLAIAGVNHRESQGQVIPRCNL